MRPQKIEDFVGQTHLLAAGKSLRLAIEQDHLHSMVFWGPSGTGKTTLARLIANYCGAQFLSISAVLSGVKEIRAAVEQAEQVKHQQRTVLFVDEVHRFNKSQQDAFLPYVEDGTFFFVGATTENPSFELNNALLSRVRTYVLKRIEAIDIKRILQRALLDVELGLGNLNIQVEDTVLDQLALFADGDARRALNYLEIAADLAVECDGRQIITPEVMEDVTSHSLRQFDNKGDLFYEQISALHKSVRGSNPDAALYWFCRMLDGGCDPIYVARRVVRMASEDIGNADPRALSIAMQAWDVYERLGSPEGELAIAHAIVYLACAAKSNAVYTAYKQAKQMAEGQGSLPVPKHLRNAPTAFMKDLGYGRDYRYDHDEADGVALEQTYFPEEIGEQTFYHPVARGLEIKIAEKLEYIKNQRLKAK